MMFYYVYRITCHHPEAVERYYYGFRGAPDPYNDTYWSSSKYVKDAISKFGIVFFKKKIIHIFDNRIKAIALEMRLHEKFQVDVNPAFFNKCKQTIWGFNCTGATVKGKTYKDLYGPVLAEELKLKRALSMKERFINDRDYFRGNRNPNFGNTWSKEKRNKLSQKVSGENNASFGLKWITDGINERKTKDVVPFGWYVGRAPSILKGKTLEKNIICPHCGALGASMGNMRRWHFDNCKQLSG